MSLIVHKILPHNPFILDCNEPYSVCSSEGFGKDVTFNLLTCIFYFILFYSLLGSKKLLENVDMSILLSNIT